MLEHEQKPIEQGIRKIRRGATNTGKVKRLKNRPLYPTSGSVTMLTDGETYTFPNPFGATKVEFLGVVTRRNQSAFVLTLNPAVSRIPVTNKSYFLESDPNYTMTITGSSSNTSIQAVPTGDDPRIPTGTWRESAATDSLFGSSTLSVSSVSVPAINIRVAVDGAAHLKPGLYFTPQTSNSVGLTGEVQKIVQCGRYFLVVDENASASQPEYAAAANEGHLINIVWNSTIVARATLVDYDSSSFKIKVTLFSNWVIDGNFICT